MENNEKSFPLFKIIYKNLLLIFLITVLSTLLAVGYSMLNKTTSVTVNQSVILRTEVKSASGGSSQSTNASHGKIYIPEIRAIITNPTAINKINEYYYEVYGKENGGINAGAIGISYKENSLIFNISYTDKSEKVAFDKLRAVYTVANEQLIKEDIKAESGSQLILTDGVDQIFSVVKTTDVAKNVIIGAVLGIVISVVIALVVYVLDNTVKDKEEFEELTNVDVISLLSKEEKQKR